MKELIREDSDFKFQRQLMDLGGCEATAFSAFDYKVTGISLLAVSAAQIFPSSSAHAIP